MNIDIVEFIEGARKATGVAVIIDVFRAFSVACYAFDSGAERVITTAEVADSFRLREVYRNSLLAGERKEKKVEGFDFGNSPTEIIRADLKGKTLIHTTSAGTQGLSNATGAGIVLAAGLVNAAATARYIKSLAPEKVSLVAMGFRANQSADEDLLCAKHIRSLLLENVPVNESEVANLRNTSGSRFFISANIDFSPPTDFFLCTMIDRFNFALKAVRRSDGNMELFRIDV